MKKENLIYDIAVIGGGPAGMMAAIQAASPEGAPFGSRRVVLLEKNKQLGKKLLLTGNGRCNLTNAEFDLKNLVANYNNGEFLFHAFSPTAGGFGPNQAINFFEKLGIKTKIENNKRVFPKSDKSDEILEALKKELEKNKVEIIYNSEVLDIKKAGKKISKIILQDGKEVTAKKYILATGGKSYPLTGSNGLGYKLAEKLGHTIITPSPALSPIKLENKWVKNLQGISLKNIKINDEFGEIMFTQSGITGPAALNISAKGETKIFIDLFPFLNQQEVLKSFEELLKKYPRQTIKNILCELVPERLAEVLLDIAVIDKNKIGNNMSKIEKLAITKILKNIEMNPENIFSFDTSMVTRGGISLKEIDHRTMQSKIISNLYFAGEIIDIDGKTGGFNLQMCWTTGYIAGQTCIF